MPIARALLPEFDHATATTRTLLERTPEERAEWRPHARSTTLGGLAAHIAVLRAMVLNRIIHHRGQLGIYLRLLDVPLPSIYGPAADTPR